MIEQSDMSTSIRDMGHGWIIKFNVTIRMLNPSLRLLSLMIINRQLISLVHYTGRSNEHLQTLTFSTPLEDEDTLAPEVARNTCNLR
jgi:hypothetical protein